MGLTRSRIVVVLGLLLAPRALAVPALTDSESFQMELYADLADLGLPEGPNAFHLNITEGQDGFPAGLYVTTGPRVSDLLVYIDGPSSMTAVSLSGVVPVSTLFAKGAYGTGLFVTEPTTSTVYRYQYGGVPAFFSAVGPPSFGATELDYHPDGTLLAADGAGGAVLRVLPNGTTQPFATIPLLPAFVSVVKPMLVLSASVASRYGGRILAGTFSLDDPTTNPLNQDKIFLVADDGSIVKEIVGGLQAPNFLTEGPGGPFGFDVYVGLFGTDVNGSGAVLRLAPDGTLTTVISGIDATHVIFDTQGVLGGGMFIADINAAPGSEALPGRIWRVIARRNVPALSGWGVIAAVLAMLAVGAIALRAH